MCLPQLQSNNKTWLLFPQLTFNSYAIVYCIQSKFKSKTLDFIQQASCGLDPEGKPKRNLNTRTTLDNALTGL